jgi:hypothetical protein
MSKYLTSNMVGRKINKRFEYDGVEEDKTKIYICTL